MPRDLFYLAKSLTIFHKFIVGCPDKIPQLITLGPHFPSGCTMPLWSRPHLLQRPFSQLPWELSFSRSKDNWLVNGSWTETNQPFKNIYYLPNMSKILSQKIYNIKILLKDNSYRLLNAYFPSDLYLQHYTFSIVPYPNIIFASKMIC